MKIIPARATGTYFITGANPRIDKSAGGLVSPDGGVAGTVVSRQGSTVVLDCGRKSVGIDFVTPPLVSYPEGVVRYYAEEHCLGDSPGTPPLDVGDTAEVMAGYGPTTVNLYDVFHVVEDGIVTDIWPVRPRGPGRP